MIQDNAYTALDGTTFRTFTDWTHITAERIIPVDLAVNRASMGLTAPRLVQAFKEIEADLNTGNIVNGFAKIDQLKRRINDIADESALLEIACCFALLPNEDPHTYLHEFNQSKLGIFKADPDCRFFFTQLAVRFIYDLGDISSDAIRMAILQRSLTESTENNGNIFPLSETGLMKP